MIFYQINAHKKSHLSFSADYNPRTNPGSGYYSATNDKLKTMYKLYKILKTYDTRLYIRTIPNSLWQKEFINGEIRDY